MPASSRDSPASQSTRWMDGRRLRLVDGMPRERYVRSIDEAKRLVESDSLADSLLPSDANVASLARESRGSALLRGAMHNSHHLGQIITIRRLMGLWPPPGGTITW